MIPIAGDHDQRHPAHTIIKRCRDGRKRMRKPDSLCALYGGGDHAANAGERTSNAKPRTTGMWRSAASVEAS